MGLIWLIGAGVAGKQSAYNAGQLSHSHQLFTRDCASCHKVEAVWGTKVADTACLSCHDGPIHQAQQTFSPPARIAMWIIRAPSIYPRFGTTPARNATRI